MENNCSRLIEQEVEGLRRFRRASNRCYDDFFTLYRRAVRLRRLYALAAIGLSAGNERELIMRSRKAVKNIEAIARKALQFYLSPR